MALPVPHHRFTVAEYHQMAETGILKREDRVELINGEVREMAAVSPRHAAGVRGSYQSVRKVHRGETISLLALPNVALRADELLG
jgi:hypothetical protein